MPVSPDLIKQMAADLHPELIRIRRHLHQYPELSYKEFETKKFIESELVNIGLSPVTKAKTGLIADISGSASGKNIALRADIDALPIYEAEGRSYRSKNEGVMHACGHDAHTACLLGALRILNELRAEWKGSIRGLFQPGEEKLPGGATLMIADGALKNPKPDYIIGQHVFPDLPVGTVGFRPGAYMASTDEIYITVIGKGGHAALPHKLVDPILISSHLILAMQQLVSRNAPANVPVVLSFGKIQADGATNVIPDQVKLEGTLRTMDDTVRQQMHHQLRKLADGLCASMGAQVKVDIRVGYPVLNNHVQMTEHLMKKAVVLWDPKDVHQLDIRMTAEDFAWYAKEIPGCFYRFGTGNPSKGITSGLHSTTFDIDEDALVVGAATMAWLALQVLEADF
jgi:amidohydrolase